MKASRRSRMKCPNCGTNNLVYSENHQITYDRKIFTDGTIDKKRRIGLTNCIYTFVQCLLCGKEFELDEIGIGK